MGLSYRLGDNICRVIFRLKEKQMQIPGAERNMFPPKVFVAIQVGVIKWNTFSFQEKLEQKISILTYLQKEIKF